jgi:HEAT repeat protein
LYRHRMQSACVALAEVPAPVRERISHWVDRLTTEAYELYRRRVSEDSYLRSAAALAYFKPAIIAAGRLNGYIGQTRFTDFLLRKLQSRRTFEYAATWIENLGEGAATADVVRTLVRAVTDYEDDLVRMNAVRILGKLGEAAATTEVVSVMLGAFSDAYERTGEYIRFYPSQTWEGMMREAVVDALGELGESGATTEMVRVLLQTFTDDPDPRVCRAAGEALGKLGEAAGVVSVLLRAVTGDADSTVRASAICALGQLGEAAATEEVVSILLRAFTDDADTEVRQAAAEALCGPGEVAATEEVVSVLLRAVTDDADSGVRRRAAFATGYLGKLGESAAAANAVRVLVRAVTDDTASDVRLRATLALGRLGEMEPAEVTGALLRVLTYDAGSQVRLTAAKSLGELGEAAATEEVVSLLLRAFTDDADTEVRQAAAEALGELGDPGATMEVVRVLLRALTDDADSPRQAAAEALGRLGEATAAVRVLLRDLTDYLDGEVSGSALNAYEIENRARDAVKGLGQLGETAATEEVAKVLLRALKMRGGHFFLRQDAAEALGKLGEAAATPEVVTALLRVITRDADPQVRVSAADDLIALQGLSPGRRIFKERKTRCPYSIVKVAALATLPAPDPITGIIGQNI